jgi:Uma2 family endonuclease
MTIQQERSLLDKLLHSPRLPIYVQEFQAVLADEARKRQNFYAQITEQDKAEFINGEIIFHSPVKLRHNIVSKRLLVLLDTHVSLHGLGLVGYEKIMVSLTRNDYEPDICFFDKIKAETFKPDQMRFPAPDFIVEVLSDSTASTDREVKFDDYAAHGITEYWLIDPVAETVEQYTLQDQAYELVIKAQTGQIISCAISHFEIPIRAIFDESVNRTTLLQLLANQSRD